MKMSGPETTHAAKDTAQMDNKGAMVLRFVHGQWTKVLVEDQDAGLPDLGGEDSDDSASFYSSDGGSDESEFFDAVLHQFPVVGGMAI